MSIRQEVADLVDKAAKAAQATGAIPPVVLEEPSVERPARPEHGDYASSLPLRLARAARQSPLALAETIAKHMPAHPAIGEVSIAPPGFINIRLSDGWIAAQVNTVLGAGDRFATSDAGGGRSVQIEFVSANPTGPLHVGNGRWASIGDSLARVLTAAGYKVEKEYLVNDAGTQATVFGDTVFARYQQLFGQDVELPAGGYPGDYVIELAQEIKDEVGDRYLGAESTPEDLKWLAIGKMVSKIRSDLSFLGIEYDVWFSERSLYEDSDTYKVSMDLLRKQNAVVEKEGAVWFASASLGANKDNVLIRSDGRPTYFASDIAYHYDKFFKRGFDHVIDIWGADHQGHVSRVKTAVAALGIDESRLEIIIGQLVALKRGGETVRFSKRAGEIITLREVIEEAGADACRYFFLQRSADSQMDFDIDLAKRQSNENPVYYVQYAHARSAGVLAQAKERGFDDADGDVSLLTDPAELTLVRKMLLLPELVESIAENHEPHHLPHYALELATAFHDFYEKCRVIDDANRPLSSARLRLVVAAKQVVAIALGLMGMSAPEKM
ncbi:MAG TPA: arginine--tRNA ligase [Dehalococcoidia bacterium]|nr:arginine--tRNA ligase [Dehalococcoidia bacterium]